MIESAVDDEVLSPLRVADPYPYFAFLREKDPVHWNEQYQAWFIHRYDDVLKALKDTERFSSRRVGPVVEDGSSPVGSATPDDSVYEILKQWLVFRDAPDHTRLRRLVARGFTPRAIDLWRPRVQALVDKQLASVAGRGEMDLIRDFAYPIPAAVIAELLGVPSEDSDLFKAWSDDIMVLVFGARGVERRHERARRGVAEMAEYLSRLIQRLRKRPERNLISELIAAQDSNDGLSDDEILSNSMLFLFGGHETTTNLIGNGFRSLLRWPTEYQRLRASRALLKPAIEEVLRYDGPSKMEVRRASSDVQLRGKQIRRGDTVYLVQAAANRDPGYFLNPDRLDVARSAAGHVGFGIGVHFCIGASLARLEGSIALDALVRGLTDVEIVGVERWTPTMISRGLESLHLRYTATELRGHG